MAPTARFALLASVVAGLGLAAAAPAPAAVTTSAIAEPAAGAALHAAAGTDLAFSGTSDGAPGDPIDVRCWRPDAAFVMVHVASGTVGEGGAWTAVADGAAAPTGFCDLRAVPPSVWTGDDVSAYAPTRMTFASRTASYFDGELLTDLSISALGGVAEVRLAGAGSCALCHGATVADASIGQVGEPLWTGVGVLPGLEDDVSPVRAGAQVDGVRAYTPGSIAGEAPLVFAPWGLSWLAGMQPLEWTTTTAGDGTRTSVETQPLLRCAADPDATDGDACGALAPAGVTLRRTVTIDPTGATVEIADRWTSSDGAAHELDLHWRHQLGPSTPRVKRGWAPESFSATQAPRTVDGPAGAAAATIYAAAQPSPSAYHPQGAIVMAPAPASVTFLPGTVVEAMSNRMAVRQVVEVPATGAVTTRHVFLLGSDRAAVQAAAEAAQERLSQPEPQPEPEPEPQPHPPPEPEPGPVPGGLWLAPDAPPTPPGPVTAGGAPATAASGASRRRALTIALAVPETQPMPGGRHLRLLAGCRADACALTADGALRLSADRRVELRAAAASAPAHGGGVLRLTVPKRARPAVRRALRAGRTLEARVWLSARSADGRRAGTSTRVRAERG